MNQLIEANKLTMSSLEIAGLLRSTHTNVRVSIERLANRGVIQLPAVQLVEDKQSLSNNNKTRVYVFSGEQGKRDSIIVVAQLSPEFTAKLVDRWQELELRSNALPNFNDPVEAARAWADVKENEIKALELIKEQAPKVNYFDKVSRNDSNMSATQVAQKFGMSAIAFNKHLTELGIYNRAVKRTKTFSQDFINNGYGRMIMTERGYSQAVFTPKGEQYVTGLLTSEGII